MSDERHHLMNLLARIHRDGGHFTEKHGLEKSVEVADMVVASLLQGKASDGMLKRVVGCARCGQTHHDLPTRSFITPFKLGEDEWSRWAMCPTNNEPILVCDVAEPPT